MTRPDTNTDSNPTDSPVMTVGPAPAWLDSAMRWTGEYFALV